MTCPNVFLQKGLLCNCYLTSMMISSMGSGQGLFILHSVSWGITYVYMWSVAPGSVEWYCPLFTVKKTKQTNKIEKNKRERKRERDAHTHHYSSGEKNATSYAFLSQITGAIPLSVLQVVFHSDHAVYHILKGDILLCSFLTSLFYCWTLLE